MADFAAGPQYDVGRTTGQCVATGDALEPGTQAYAALVDIPPEQREKGDALGLARVDVSEAAWEDDGFRPDRLFSFWRTTVPDPKVKKKRFVDDTVLMELLNRLADTEEPSRLAFRHVLALLMLRKKLLRLDGREKTTDGDAEAGTDADGETVAEYWLLTPKLDVTKGWNGKWNEDVQLRVLDPGLDDAGLTAVTDQLRQIMDDGVDMDAAAGDGDGD